jgi:transposase
VVDDAGKVILEQRAPTEPADIIAVLTSLAVPFGRIGIEAGPLSQWLVNGLMAADLPVICVETRHMKALLTAQQISKTDRNDARGIAQMMRVGLFKPVYVKTLVAQEQRMLLTSRKLLQRKLLDVESDLRGTLRNFGLRVGVVSSFRYEGRVRELVAGFRGWPQSSSRCSVSAGSCASSWPSCKRCCWIWSAAIRCAGG